MSWTPESSGSRLSFPVPAGTLCKWTPVWIYRVPFAPKASRKVGSMTSWQFSSRFTLSPWTSTTLGGKKVQDSLYLFLRPRAEQQDSPGSLSLWPYPDSLLAIFLPSKGKLRTIYYYTSYLGPKNKMSNVKQANNRKRLTKISKWKTTLKTSYGYLESTISCHHGLVLPLRNIDLRDSFSFTEQKVPLNAC